MTAVRSLPARLGLTALNVLAPGAGLLRLGRWRAGLLLLSLVPFSLLLLIIVFAAFPELPFDVLLALAAVIALATLGALVVSVFLSWRHGECVEERGPWYARWYPVLAAVVMSFAVAQQLVEVAHRFYKPFYMPSESMMPTLLKNDHFVAIMGQPTSRRRGDVVLVRVGDAVYVKRLAGLPGDRIALKRGIVWLNDVAVPQQYERDDKGVSAFGASARRLRETFPGEKGSHEIYDDGPFPVDDFAEVTVAKDHVFLLGDNRDESADSRVPRAEMGIEQAPFADLVGRALYYTSGPSHRGGQRINPD